MGYTDPNQAYELDDLQFDPDEAFARALGSDSALGAIQGGGPVPNAAPAAVPQNAVAGGSTVPPIRPLPQAPTFDQERYDKLSTPTDPSSVKPGLWAKILGGFAAGTGGALAAAQRRPTNIGEEINQQLFQRPFERAEATRLAQLKDFETQNNQKQQLYRDQITGYQAQTSAENTRALQQFHEDQLNEKKGEMVKQYTAVDPTDKSLHQYEVDRAGKVYDRGVAAKDQDQINKEADLAERTRHDKAEEGIAATRANKEGQHDHSSKLADIDKWKQDQYLKLEGEKAKGYKAAEDSVMYNDPQYSQKVTAAKAAVDAEYAKQAKIIDDGYASQRSQLGVAPTPGKNDTVTSIVGDASPRGSDPINKGGSGKTTVTNAPPKSTPDKSSEVRIRVSDPKGNQFTIPSSQRGLVGQGKYAGWKVLQ